jgi:hypothetical protein
MTGNKEFERRGTERNDDEKGGLGTNIFSQIRRTRKRRRSLEKRL